jgi:hypothetical protein
VASFGFTVSGDRRWTTPEIPRRLRPSPQARCRLVFADHDLRDARAVADVEERHAAKIADPVHPPEQHDVGANVLGTHATACVGAFQISEMFSHQ